MVQVVVAQKEARIDGLGQQGVDGDHNQQHRQLQDRVQAEENCTGHHGQHPGEDKVLETERGEVVRLNRNTGGPIPSAWVPEGLLTHMVAEHLPLETSGFPQVQQAPNRTHHFLTTS